MSRPSVDIVAQGVAGTLSLTGESEGHPTKAGFPAADILGGLFGALLGTSALAYREHTRQGQRIDIGLLDAMMLAMAYEFCYYCRIY